MAEFNEENETTEAAKKQNIKHNLKIHDMKKSSFFVRTNIFARAYNRLRDEILYARLSLWTRFVYNRRACRGEIKSMPKGDFCDLAVIAFNNPKVIDYQIRTIRKFFHYPYRYTVFDNSTIEERSTEIKQICTQRDIGYIRLPQQEGLPVNMGSYSHGIACNYMYEKYIRNGGGKFFGLLDHDIFPIEPFDVSSYLSRQPFYGTKHGFYIWPGFFFVRMDWVRGKKLDFRPSLHLRGDTGACNYYSLFKGIDFSKYNLVRARHVIIDGHDDIFQYGYSRLDCGWIHCWNGSNYMKKDSIELKMRTVYKLLDEKLA